MHGKTIITGMRSSFLFFVFLFFIAHSPCRGHGVEYRRIGGGAGVEVRYDDGTPMQHSEVTVYTPSEEEKVFQLGHTDGNGRFLFFPDTAGIWKVKVNDGMGHGIIAEISTAGENLQDASPYPSFSRREKIITGVSIIWGFTGLLFYIAAKKNNRKKENAHP
jgi:nickel transport protein